MPQTPADGKSFWPSPYSSGAEGLCFIADWCDNCAKRGQPDDETGCQVLSDSFLGPVAEWVWQDGKPTCLVFQPTPAGPDDPPPFDPRQMTLEEQV